MEVIVEDTNILIDLFNIGLVRQCQLLDIEFHTTTYVVLEMIRSDQQKLLMGLIANGMLTVDGFEDADFELLNNTIRENTGLNNLSQTDWSVLLLAERLKCRLLTSDQKLRRQAEARGVTVNGLLWLIDKMVADGIVLPRDMADILQHYIDTNPRAPENEIQNRIDKLQMKLN